jgi:N5-(cytidine 5'-diphosphoramidyl)-L-glutamine hydrolase
MMLIAISMLRVHDKQRDEWRDAIDERWARLLWHCNLTAMPLPNDARAAAHLLSTVRPGGLLLTGGGDCAAISGRPDCRDETESVAIDWAEKVATPVFAVCRGMQMLVCRGGGRVEKRGGHTATRHDIRFGDVRRSVNSYHDYAVLDAPGFDVAATADDGSIEWVMRPQHRQQAVMWHPEREGVAHPADIALLKQHFGVLD